MVSLGHAAPEWHWLWKPAEPGAPSDPHALALWAFTGHLVADPPEERRGVQITLAAQACQD